jgi:foldase protein PrsA
LKRSLGAVVIGCVALSAGCAAQPARDASPVQNLIAAPAPAGSHSSDSASTVTTTPPPPANIPFDDRVIARINGQPVTMGELMKPLLEAHGLQILTGLVQLDLLKQEARADHAPVSPEDVRHEREMALGKMFKDADAKEQDQLDEAEQKGQTADAEKLRAQISSDREGLLTQYLENQHFSRAEFDLKMEINAYLRKKAERLLTGKITDAMVEKEFNVEYGETRDVRYIQLANMQQVAEARQRLKTEDFGDVAASYSGDARTGNSKLKGMLSGISLQTPGLPKTFKEMAFSVELGQVSETLNLEGHYFILKPEKKYPPKAVKFDKIKDSLRKSMFDRLVQSLMEQLSSNVGQEVVQKLQIEDPILKKQYEQFMSRQQSEIRDRAKMNEQFKKEREAHSLTTQPAATEPAAADSATSAPAATAPASAAPAPAAPAARP